MESYNKFPFMIFFRKNSKYYITVKYEVV